VSRDCIGTVSSGSSEPETQAASNENNMDSASSSLLELLALPAPARRSAGRVRRALAPEFIPSEVEGCVAQRHACAQLFPVVEARGFRPANNTSPLARALALVSSPGSLAEPPLPPVHPVPVPCCSTHRPGCARCNSMKTNLRCTTARHKISGRAGNLPQTCAGYPSPVCPVLRCEQSAARQSKDRPFAVHLCPAFVRETGDRAAAKLHPEGIHA
jgi:hypothetical protein